MKEYSIERVLVAVDFSHVSINALQTATALCRKHDATLTLVHVIENTRFLYSPVGGLTAVSLLPELTRAAEERLGVLATQVRHSQRLRVSLRILTGHPAEAICQEAFRSESDLVVIGSHGASSINQLLVGSTAYLIAKSSPVPVLTVPANDRRIDFRKILFPVRAQSFSDERYDFVRPIIQREQASVLLTGMIDQSSETDQDEIEETIQGLHEKYKSDNISCDVKYYACESVVERVLDIANEEKPDLIVITTTTSTNGWDFFAVAYPDEVINQTGVPVLSIRPTDEVNAQVKAAQAFDDWLDVPRIAFG